MLNLEFKKKLLRDVFNAILCCKTIQIWYNCYTTLAGYKKLTLYKYLFAILLFTKAKSVLLWTKYEAETKTNNFLKNCKISRKWQTVFFSTWNVASIYHRTEFSIRTDPREKFASNFLASKVKQIGRLVFAIFRSKRSSSCKYHTYLRVGIEYFSTRIFTFVEQSLGLAGITRLTMTYTYRIGLGSYDMNVFFFVVEMF